MKPKLLRITTVPISMNILLKGQLKYMTQHFEVVGATTYDEKHFNETAAREGVRMKAVTMIRTIAPIADLKALWKLYRLIKVERPLIVHTHTPKAGLLGMLAARFAGVPIRMHTVAGLPMVGSSGLRKMVLSSMEQLTYWCAHKVYPNSAALATLLTDMKLAPADKFKVILNGSSNGIDTEHFQFRMSVEERKMFRSNIGIEDDEIVFSFVGRLCTDKGIRELASAFEFVEQQNPQSRIKLLLVGPYEKDNGVLDAETIDKLENSPNILCVGRHDDIRPYLESSDIFVFPSYREGFPNVVLQAGAMGLPSIVSDINGCNEIIIDGYNGLIVPVKDVQELGNAMQNLLLEPGLRDQLASNARPNIVGKYDQKMLWQELLQEYHTRMQHVTEQKKARN